MKKSNPQIFILSIFLLLLIFLCSFLYLPQFAERPIPTLAQSREPQLMLTQVDCLRWSGDLADLTILEEQAEIVFPENAENIEAVAIAGWQECLVYLRFEIDLVDLPSLLESSYVDNLRFAKLNEYSPFEDIPPFRGLENWQFDMSQNYFYGNGSHPTAQEGQDLLGEILPDGQLRIYLITYLS